jgi:molybdate transport system substrate-binding protein
MSRFQAVFWPCTAVVGLAWAALSCAGPSDTSPPEVRISVAASLAHVIEGLADRVRDDLGIRITVNTAASGTLVQQISRGNRADIFISADPRWMDHLAKRGMIDETSSVDLASNRLVLVGLPGAGARPGDLSALSEKRYQPIAVGDPAYVPAGRYAIQALKAHGLNPDTQLNLAEAPDARAALAFVLSGQCPVGLVYASDALNVPGVEVLMKIDRDDHDPIRYPAVVLTDAPRPAEANRVLHWLSGTTARQALWDAGFEPGR